jgi:CheY-like chemotaxis protein
MIETTHLPSTATSAALPANPAAACDVLLADDNASLRNLMAEYLKARGYTVVEAGDGRAALAVLGARRVTMVITDIFMPDMDGFQLIMNLRSRYPGIGILAISGDNGLEPEHFLKVARLLGVRRTLTKPFLLSEMASIVREVVRGGSC